MNGALYVENYKYQNGVWTDLGTMQTIHSIGKWGNKVVYSVETGSGNYSIMMYDSATLSTIATTDAVNIGSIVLVGGALTVDAKEIENASVVAFPNPSNGVVSFTSVCDAISVYSATGQLLISKTNSQQVDLSGHVAGVYLVKIQIDGNSKVFNLIKK